MTILEQLREKKKDLPSLYIECKTSEEQKLYDLVEQYDLALENALLKLKNRGIEIADLKHRLNDIKWLEPIYKKPNCPFCNKLLKKDAIGKKYCMCIKWTEVFNQY